MGPLSPQSLPWRPRWRPLGWRTWRWGWTTGCPVTSNCSKCDCSKLEIVLAPCLYCPGYSDIPATVTVFGSIKGSPYTANPCYSDIPRAYSDTFWPSQMCHCKRGGLSKRQEVQGRGRGRTANLATAPEKRRQTFFVPRLVSWRESSGNLWMPSRKSHYTYHTDWKIDRLTAGYRDRRQDVAQEMD